MKRLLANREGRTPRVFDTTPSCTDTQTTWCGRATIRDCKTVDLDARWFGTRDIKFRLTQGLSFTSNKRGPSQSINDRVDMTAYAKMVYGWCFPCIMHYVVSMRAHQPHRCILNANIITAMHTVALPTVPRRPSRRYLWSGTKPTWPSASRMEDLLIHLRGVFSPIWSPTYLTR